MVFSQYFKIKTSINLRQVNQAEDGKGGVKKGTHEKKRFKFVPVAKGSY
jgi:hypothetical protein